MAKGGGDRLGVEGGSQMGRAECRKCKNKNEQKSAYEKGGACRGPR